MIICILHLIPTLLTICNINNINNWSDINYLIKIYGFFFYKYIVSMALIYSIKYVNVYDINWVIFICISEINSIAFKFIK